MADKDITIGIRTTADTKGAKAATDALKETTRAVSDLGGSSNALNDRLTATGNTSEGVASKMGGRLRGTFQQVGYQVQDFSTQVAMGTSAVTAFGQQAPQLLGAFGPAGAVAGALVSIGALAYGVFSKMGGDVQSAKEKLDDMAAAIEEIAKNKGLELEDEFTDASRAIDNAVARAAALKQEFVETKKAVNELALAQLDLAAENAKAARTDMEIKGKPANMKQADWEKAMAPLKAIEESAIAAAEKNREQARQALVSDQDRLQTAKEAVAEAAKMLAAKEAERLKAEELLAVERKLIAALREKESALKKYAEGKGRIDKIPFPELQEIADESLKKIGGAGKLKGDIREGAKKLSGPGSLLSGQLASAEERITVLEKALTDRTAKLNTDITAAENEVLKTQTKLTDTTAAVKIGAETINTDLERKTTAQIDDLKKAGLDTAKTVTDAATTAIKAVTDEAANQSRALSPVETEAVERLRKLVADTVPDSAQGAQLQGILQSLANNLTAKDAALATGVERLISIARGQATQYASLLNRINELDAKIKQNGK
jgi:hypothetical protein